MGAPIFSSPKTSAAAIAILVADIGYVAATWLGGNPGDIQWEVVITGIVTAFGFLFARDNNKSSEYVGVK